MKQNILNAWRGGAVILIGLILSARHLVLIYYWVNVVYYWVAPRAAYHLSREVELHAVHTYCEYLTRYPDDQEIVAIMNDEVQHYQELNWAMEKL